MGVCLRTKFKVSSIILTSLRQGGWGGGVSNFTSSKRAPEKPTQIRVNIFHNFIPNKNIICNDKDPPNQNTD